MFVQAHSERRAQHRHRLEVPVELDLGDGQPVRCQTEDVSTGGARVLIPRGLEVPVGTRCTIKLFLPLLTAPATIHVEVRWVSAGALGCSFVAGLRAQEVWAINQMGRRAPV